MDEPPVETPMKTILERFMFAISADSERGNVVKDRLERVVEAVENRYHSLVCGLGSWVGHDGRRDRVHLLDHVEAGVKPDADAANQRRAHGSRFFEDGQPLNGHAVDIGHDLVPDATGSAAAYETHGVDFCALGAEGIEDDAQVHGDAFEHGAVHVGASVADGQADECARVDGATRWQAFFRIVLPLSAPGLVAVAIFSFIFAWNEYLFALMLTNFKAITMPVLIAGQNNTRGIEWWFISALTLMAVVPVIIMGLLLERFITRGLTAGAVKG